MAEKVTRYTFSIRVPEDLVVEISRRALDRGLDRNTIMNELLRQGVGQARNFDKAVRDFVFREVTKEELCKLETGL